MSPADKLRKVADFVDGLRTALFDMRYWVCRPIKPVDDDSAYRVIDPVKELNDALIGNSCSTAACFVGWATMLLPEDLSFNEQPAKTNSSFFMPQHNRTKALSVAAVVEVFGLTDNEADSLCLSDRYDYAGWEGDPARLKDMVVSRARELADKVEARS